MMLWDYLKRQPFSLLKREEKQRIMKIYLKIGKLLRGIRLFA